MTGTQFAERMSATPVRPEVIEALAAAFLEVAAGSATAREYWGALTLAMATECRKAASVDPELGPIFFETHLATMRALPCLQEQGNEDKPGRCGHGRWTHQACRDCATLVPEGGAGQ